MANYNIRVTEQSNGKVKAEVTENPSGPIEIQTNYDIESTSEEFIKSMVANSLTIPHSSKLEEFLKSAKKK